MWLSSPRCGAHHGIAGDEHPDQVSPEVRQRVLDAITHRLCAQLHGGRAGVGAQPADYGGGAQHGDVGLHGNHRALNSTLFDAGCQLMLGQSGFSADREELLLEAIIGRRPDGIFLTGIMGAGRGATRLVASGIRWWKPGIWPHRHAGGFLAP